MNPFKWFGWVSDSVKKLLGAIEEHEKAIKELSADVSALGRRVEGLNALEERLEKEAYQKAYESARVEFDFAIKKLAKMIEDKAEETLKTCEECKECCERVRLLEEDYQRFKTEVLGRLVRLEALENAKEFKMTNKVKCSVKAKFNAVGEPLD